MKILFSDFDNTLYVEDEKSFQNNIESIKKFINLGNIFGIITGRSYSDIKVLLNKYSIPYSYLICEDGAKIYNSTDYSINTINIDSKEVEKIIEILTDNNYKYYLDDGYNITTNINDCVKIYTTYDNYEDAKRVIELLREKTNTFSYLSRIHINITHKDANKKSALHKLIEIENLPLNDLYVIGDNVNDLEMLKSFSGAVVKNHSNDLNQLNKSEYNNVSDYIEELLNNK